MISPSVRLMCRIYFSARPRINQNVASERRVPAPKTLGRSHAVRYERLGSAPGTLGGILPQLLRELFGACSRHPRCVKCDTRPTGEHSRISRSSSTRVLFVKYVRIYAIFAPPPSRRHVIVTVFLVPDDTKASSIRLESIVSAKAQNGPVRSTKSIYERCHEPWEK